jgi:hypothetical protein
MKEIPDELYDQIKAFLHKVDDGQMDYMETYGAKDANVYDDAAALLEAIAKLEKAS